MSWVELGLPVGPMERPDAKYPERLTFHDLEVARFGTTQDLLWVSIDTNRTGAAREHVKERMPGATEPQIRKEILSMLPSEQAEKLGLWWTIGEWMDRDPEVKARLIAYNQAYTAARQAAMMDTAHARGLLRAGVQIEMEDGKRYLIGHINEQTGACDDCVLFERTDVVRRYRVLCDPGME